jgi:hypothetical protein
MFGQVRATLVGGTPWNGMPVFIRQPRQMKLHSSRLVAATSGRCLELWRALFMGFTSADTRAPAATQLAAGPGEDAGACLRMAVSILVEELDDNGDDLADQVRSQPVPVCHHQWRRNMHRAGSNKHVL